MTGMQWKCPVCGEALLPHPEEKRFCCAKRHSFDMARQGYVNLLLPQKRGASLPGDNAAMVRARTAFLEAGYYKAFSDGVNALCLEALGTCSAPVIADAGCGEGYYTGRLAKALLTAGKTPALAGFDLAKDAVSHAAREAGKQQLSGVLHYAVASLFEMPLASHSADGILNLFAPAAEAEFARILRPGGFLLMAVPAAEHLMGLKEAVYDTPYPNEVRRDILAGFTLEKVQNITYEITLTSNADIQALFAMTPYFWKTSVSDRKKLDLLETLTTPAAFDLLLYRADV